MRCSLADHVADVVAATAAAVMLAITVLGFAVGCGSQPPSNADRATNDVQIARLQRHFAAVDAELRAADVSHLTAAQRAARTEAIDRLRVYASRAQFPHNHHRADRTPVFIDEHGTRCAMAHLIEEADGAALVAKVAREQNLAYVPELAADLAFQPELVAWLDRNGLSAAEAARIQPAYDGCEFQDCTERIDPTALVASMALATGNGAVIALNLRDDASTRTGVFGLLVGGASMFGGYMMVKTSELNTDRELQRDLGWIDIGLGAASAVLSIRTLTRDRAPAYQAPVAPVGPGGWSVAPIVGPTRGVSFAKSF
jgi:hypothetical protein